jgi:uncharacterized protein YcaQ
MTDKLGAKEAKLLALHASGLSGKADKTVLDVIARFGMLQIDSVNVFERAHYLPLFSRLGSFDKSELDSLTGGKNPILIEYWAHQASFIKTEDFPLYDWRMQWYRDRAAEKDSFASVNKKLIAKIRAEILANGPMTSSQFEHEDNVRKGSWWGWSDVKRSLEGMIFRGELIAAGRENFRRIYALPEQILPAKILNKTIQHDTAREIVLSNAARLMGVGTVKDIANVHCQTKAEVMPYLKALLEQGIVKEVEVEGWQEKAYLHKDFFDYNFKEIKPNLTTVLSPFDPLTWQRERALRIFNFDYKIEIYTPEPKRIYGYYCLPMLHKDKLAGRIDLKSDRQNKALLIQSAWREDSLSSAELKKFSVAITRHLEEVKKWQKLNTLVSKGKGNLAI